MIKFYNFWNSSASYRVRIGLYFKEIPFENIHINIRKAQGEQFTDEYKKVNPQNLVPAIILDDGKVITQSLVILDYLDSIYQTHPLTPLGNYKKAIMNILTQTIAIDIQPINNLRIIKYLKSELGANDEKTSSWSRHWIELGFKAYEENLKRYNFHGKFSFGDEPGLADICLIPQIYNAKMHNVDMEAYPILSQIDKNCSKLEAFIKSKPENQKHAVL